jgi:hypothetical protein
VLSEILGCFAGNGCLFPVMGYIGLCGCAFGWLSPFLFGYVDVFLASVDSWFDRLSELILLWCWLFGCACLDLTVGDV